MPKIKREGSSAAGSNHGKPRKPATAFVMFSNQWREQIKSDNPGISFTDIGRKLGEMWREMKPELKKVYQDRSVEAKEKYLAEKQVWLQAKQKEELLSSQVQQSMGHVDHQARHMGAWEHAQHQNFGIISNLGVGTMSGMMGGGFATMHHPGGMPVHAMHGHPQHQNFGIISNLGVGTMSGMMGGGFATMHHPGGLGPSVNHHPMMSAQDGARMVQQNGMGQHIDQEQ
jgi:hypothetical protein